MLSITQLWFDFTAAVREESAPKAARQIVKTPRDGGDAAEERDVLNEGRDAVLEAQCRQLLLSIDLPGMAGVVKVVWNPKLRSTAGYARYPAWVIELNPRLREFDGQVERTLKHELAHLVAYHRAGRRRIEPHGPQWRRACADLGIPGERAQHHLPLPRHEVRRNYTYACPSCGVTVRRVRKFRRFTACLPCCKRHSGGEYDRRFQFVLVSDARKQP